MQKNVKLALPICINPANNVNQIHKTSAETFCFNINSEGIQTKAMSSKFLLHNRCKFTFANEMPLPYGLKQCSHGNAYLLELLRL